MKKLFFTLISFCYLTALEAQMPGRSGGGQQLNIGRFYGKIVDEKTGKPVEAATVQLSSSIIDRETKARKDTVLGGMFTSKNGDFSLPNLPIMGKFKLEVTAIGYTPFSQDLAFDLRGGQGDPAMAMAALDKDLGNLSLKEDADLLESVTVTGSKPLMQMGIDRKIFNVEKNINSAGGSAVDVMRNVPTLNVDIDGNVTMRNSAPQIFVDGRISTLTLEQIPADAIESVELITNPSAKFDASGGQSGILNIVLKKTRKVGYNGGIRAGIDSRARINAGGDFNVRQGKFNVFASGMYNQRKSISWGETDRRNFIDDSRTIQKNDAENLGAFAFGRFGVDYFMDNRNTFTITQSLVRGNFDSENYNNSIINNLNPQSFYETQYRNTNSEFQFRNYGTMLSYKHLFAHPGKEVTADVNFNRSKNSNHSDIRFRSFNDISMQDPKSAEGIQTIHGGGNNNFFTGQIDYINPINQNMKWESGLRAQVRTFSSNQLNALDGVSKPNLDNNFEYTDYVYAAYATFSQKVQDKFNYQLGLRAESSSYTGEQIGKAEYKNEFPISLFPSVFITKQLNEKQDIQLNYSRRINRPNFFQLMPNTDYSDPLNYQTGNPGLKPEFTNSLELSYQNTYGKNNNTFLATIFGKYTTNLISRFQERRQLGESDTLAFVSTWENANAAYAGGLELVFRNNFFKWWEFNLNTNVYYSKIDGANIASDLNNERVSSFTKLNNTFKVQKGWSLQLSADYQSKSALPVSTSNSGGGGRGGGGGGWMGGSPSTTQGYIDANFGIDLGLRKDFKIKNNQANISVNFSDIFRTRRYFVHSESTGFVQDDWRRRDPQIVRVNFSYRFGKFDAALFKRKNMRNEGEGMQNNIPGMQ